MGIFSELHASDGTLDHTTMMLRDLTGPVAVADGLTILGRFTFTLAV